MPCPHCKSNFVTPFMSRIHCYMCGRDFNTGKTVIVVKKVFDGPDETHSPRRKSAMHECKICGRYREMRSAGMCFTCHTALRDRVEGTPEYNAAVARVLNKIKTSKHINRHWRNKVSFG